MRLLTVLLISTFVQPASAQVPTAVTDPGLTIVAKGQLAVANLHHQFMQLQMVQDALTLKQNYEAAMEYYDTIYAHSQHRGGLMGYYKDFFDQQFHNIAADEWRRLQTEGSDTSGTAVNAILNSASSAISGAAGTVIDGAAGAVNTGMNGLNTGTQALGAGQVTALNARTILYLQKQHKVNARDKMIAMSETRADATAVMVQDIVTRGMRDMINDSESESISLHAQVLSLQMLGDIRQLLNMNAEALNELAKESLTETALAIKNSTDLKNYRASKTTTNTAPATTDQLVHEMQRGPGQ